MDDLITDQKITSPTLIHRKEPSLPFLGLSVSTFSVVTSPLWSESTPDMTKRFQSSTQTFLDCYFTLTDSSLLLKVQYV